MQVFNSIPEFRQIFSNCVATIGKYDGMHLGHQQILQQLCLEAASAGLPSVVILSEPQPEEFFAGDRAPARLSHFRDKVDYLGEFGIDAVFRLTFDLTLSQYSPQRFIEEILVSGLGIKSLIVGHDFRFGKDRAGDFALLESYGKQYGFGVKQEAEYRQAGERISSTLVRQYLQRDELDKVARLLGRPYSISGEVTRGQQLGRKLGAPTANIALTDGALALSGIYAVRVVVKEQEYTGVASVGYRPTVTDSGEPLLEVYLFDFTDNLYGERLRVSFLHKIRAEEKFASLEALQQQIAEDVALARDYFDTCMRGEAR